MSDTHGSKGDSEYTDAEWADIVKDIVPHYATPKGSVTSPCYFNPPAPKKYTLVEVAEMLETELPTSIWMPQQCLKNAANWLRAHSTTTEPTP